MTPCCNCGSCEGQRVITMLYIPIAFLLAVSQSAVYDTSPSSDPLFSHVRWLTAVIVLLVVRLNLGLSVVDYCSCLSVLQTSYLPSQPYASRGKSWDEKRVQGSLGSWRRPYCPCAVQGAKEGSDFGVFGHCLFPTPTGQLTTCLILCRFPLFETSFW